MMVVTVALKFSLTVNETLANIDGLCIYTNVLSC